MCVCFVVVVVLLLLLLFLGGTLYSQPVCIYGNICPLCPHFNNVCFIIDITENTAKNLSMYKNTRVSTSC